MPYRCINAFVTGDRTVSGGALVEDDDSILSTHAEFFRPVDVPAKLGSETATAGTRSKSGPKPKVKQPVVPASAEPTLPVDEASKSE